MMISKSPGCVVLEKYRDELGFVRPPSLIFLLCPNLSNEDFEKLCGRAREMDRLTSDFIHTILFWASKPNKDFSERELRNRMLNEEFLAQDIRNLKHGSIDESYVMANLLGIPYANLPCIIIFDDLDSSDFYQLPYEGVNEFISFTTSIVDFLQKDYIDYFQIKKALYDANDKVKNVNSIKSKAQVKKTISSLAKEPKIRAILEELLSQLDTYEQEENDVKKTILHILNHPLDLTAKEKLETKFEGTKYFSKVNEFYSIVQQELYFEAEVSVFGDTRKEIIKKRDNLMASFIELPRPILKKLLDKEKRKYKLRRASEMVGNSGGVLKTVSDVIRSLSATALKFAGFFV